MQPLLLLPLLLGSAAPPVASAAPRLEATQDTYEGLVSAYQEASDAYRVELRTAKGMKAKKAVRGRHPVKTYWPRFEALAERDARAYLLMVEHVDDLGLERGERNAKKVGFYEHLFATQTRATWIVDALGMAARERRLLEEDALLGAFHAVYEANESRAVKAHCLNFLSRKYLASSDEERKRRGQELFSTLAAEFRDTPEGRQAAEEEFALKHLGLGCEAPDFEAATIDGHEFSLSDYRGKVVLLDFYGFW